MDYSARSCVLYSVGRISGDTASFCLISVRTKDSNGAIDDLEIAGNATVFGGVRSGCPVIAEDVFPRAAVAGQANTLTVRGRNFSPASWVTLVNNGVAVAASSVTIQDQGTATASIEVPADMTGAASLIVGTAENADTLADELTIPDRLNTYHPQRIVAWFAPSVVRMPNGATSASVESALYADPRVKQLLQQAGIVHLRMLTPSATVANLAGLDASQLDMYVCELADTNVASAVAQLRADTVSVRYAGPDWAVHGSLVPNDANFGRQWWLRNTGQFGGAPGADLHVIGAWDQTTGGPAVDVAVLDTGCDPLHPDLAGRVVMAYNALVGCSPLVWPDCPPPYDDHAGSHGTSVAGMIAALGNGGGNVAGVDWTARIVAVKVLDSTGVGWGSWFVDGLDWARVQGYRLINASLGSPSWDPTTETVVRNAYKAGMAIFAAMGNNNGPFVDYPAGFAPRVIAVGAMMHLQDRWDDYRINWQLYGVSGPPGGPYYGSNYGPHIRFVAPGGRFIETSRRVATGSYWNTDPYTQNWGFSGTSAAAPAAAGTAALLESWNATLTNEDLAEILSRKTDPVPGHVEEWDEEVGYGSINAERALAMISGQNRVEHGEATTIVDAAQENLAPIYVQDWPGLTPGDYVPRRHTLRGTATFAAPFDAPPTVWPRQIASYGTDFIPNPLSEADLWNWTPAVWVSASTQTGVTLETYFYGLIPEGGTAEVGWWPATPDQARFAFTAVGPSSVVGVAGPGAGTGVALSATPNPGGGKTALRFALRERSEIRLAIYDVSGRLVRTLEARMVSAGPHSYDWDLRSRDGVPVSSGLYFARLQAGSRDETVRFTVLK